MFKHFVIANLTSCNFTVDNDACSSDNDSDEEEDESSEADLPRQSLVKRVSGGSPAKLGHRVLEIPTCSDSEEAEAPPPPP